MMLVSVKQKRPALIFCGLVAGSLAGLLLLPPIPQDQGYHHFADQRTLFGVPNFWNVVSNLPFIAVGSVGLRRFHRNPAIFVIFLGIFLTGFGSSYYHWDPSDRTLFWDRLPITLCFMAILAVVVEERVSARLGAALAMAASGNRLVQSVAVALDRRSAALRWVQFFPYLALPLLLLMCQPKYSGTFYWVAAAALYALAKLFEL